MAGRQYKDYTIRTQYDGSQALKDYEKYLKERRALERRYGTGAGAGSGGSGGRGSGGGSSGSEERRRRREEERAARDEARRNTPGRRQQGLSNRMDFQIGRMASAANISGMDTAALRAQVDVLRSLRAQLNRVRSASDIDRLGNQYREAYNNANRLMREQRRINSELNVGARAGRRFTESLARAGMGLASFYAVASAGKAVFRIGKELDSMQASLLAASGGTEQAAKNFEFLKQTSKDLGKDLTTMVGGFNRLGVAARAAGLSDGHIKEIFLAASESATTFGLSTQNSSRVMLAMSQIMS